MPPKLPPQSRGAGPIAAGLVRLNEAAPGVAEAALLTCCGSRRWARRMADHRPFPGLGALRAAAIGRSCPP